MQNSIDCLNSCVQEGLINIRLIKSFVRKDYEEKRFDEHNKDLFDKNINAMNIMIKYQPVMTLALNATTVAVVWFGGNMIIGGKMQGGRPYGIYILYSSDYGKPYDAFNRIFKLGKSSRII